MNLFQKKSVRNNNIKKIAINEYSSVFGGDKNDCICYLGTGLFDSASSSFHDIKTEKACKNLCCNFGINPNRSYSYRHGDIKKCENKPEITETIDGFEVISFV